MSDAPNTHSDTATPTSLTDLLDRLDQAATPERPIHLGTVLDAAGRRSFAPFLLIAGLITVTPLIGDIPGVPSLMAALVILASSQLLCGRDSVWLPRRLVTRRIDYPRFAKTLAWLRRPARGIDRMLKPRLVWLTRSPAHLAIAVTCLGISLAMPPMEVIPFSANLAGLALTLFGLALIARDGLMALLGYLFTATTVIFIVFAV